MTGFAPNFHVYFANNGWCLEIPKREEFIDKQEKMITRVMKPFLDDEVDKVMDNIEKKKKKEPIHGIFLFPTWEELSEFVKLHYRD